jgi:hypothetical protein
MIGTGFAQIRSGGAQLIVPGLDVRQGGGSSDASWWLAAGVTPVAAYAAKGAASLASSYINLALPGTYDLTTTQAPTFVAGGWDFDSAGDFLTATVTVDTTWTVMARFNIATQGRGTNFGRLFSARGDRYSIIPWTQTTLTRDYLNGTVTASPGTNVTSGTDTTMAIAGANLYLGGSSDGSLTTGALLAGDLCIGNRLSDKARTFGGIVSHLAVFDSGLSSPQIAALHAAMAAL